MNCKSSLRADAASRCDIEMRNLITFCTSLGKNFPYQKLLLPLAENLLKQEGKPARVNVVLLSDEEQRALNRDFRKLDKVTDVLSFEWNEPNFFDMNGYENCSGCVEKNAGFLGEIYIAEGQVKRQAPQYGNTYYRELKRVLIHGLLHLCGYDHCKKGERKIMRARENYFDGKEKV